jgi:uncharacterized membrane protein
MTHARRIRGARTGSFPRNAGPATGDGSTLARVRALLDTGVGRLVAAVLGGVLLATLLAMALLWPSGERASESGTQRLNAGATDSAEVRAVVEGGCEAEAGPDCRRLAVELRSGAREGEEATLTLPGDEFQPEVSVGDRIRVTQLGGDDALGLGGETLPGTTGTDAPYVFVDFERGRPLLLLALIFVGLVVAFGRRRGLLSLLGLGVSLFVVVQFVVPAILQGTSPLAVALIGASAVMFATILLTHGVGVKSAAAMLGTLGSLVLTALLAVVFVEAGSITGLVSEEATLLRGGSGGALSVQGLVLAGMVIGALGVLDDVTISQASSVMALRRVNPLQRFADLYREAIAIGRDHVGATVNTLVLAYVGAALPVLLIFETQGTGIGTAIQREQVAQEVVATLVGSIGLIAAVPLTTALAALLAERLPASALEGEGGHGHAH